MRTLIIGASAAGLYSAILIKRKHPDMDVFVFDKEAKAGKKIYATGNGHCNVLAKNLYPEAYNHPEFMRPLLDKYPYEYLKETIESFGVPLLEKDNLVYPLSYSAASYVQSLLSLCEKLGIKIQVGEKVESYISGDVLEVTTDKGVYKADRLVFATGGGSQPNLGSDGTMFPIYHDHGYKIIGMRPGLCPAKLENPDRSLDGLRHKAKVTVFNDHKEIYSEVGEILWRKDGLSGIAIFNAESAIERNEYLYFPTIAVDLFPDATTMELIQKFMASYEVQGEEFVYSFFEKPLAEKLLEAANLKGKKDLGKKDFYELAKASKGLTYAYQMPEGYAHSQVTIGGIDLNNVDEHLQSKIEKSVQFAGECLDIDGFCGGFNLTWCLISALLVADL